MLGINYESSDEEEPAAVTSTPVAQAEVTHANTLSEGAIATNIELPKLPTAPPDPKPVETTVKELTTLSETTSDPVQGPTVTPPPPDEDLPEDVPPGSPYTSNRLMIQNLTLPPIPNLDIPPSPPGSPSQSTTKKFTQFLELKKKGQHFNRRLEDSSVLRDPNHLPRLLEFAGIGEEDQYASTLPEGLAVPTAWPQWAYAEELDASQKKISKEKEAKKKNNPHKTVDFVPATKSGVSSGTGTPASKTSQSTTERARTSLDPEHSSSHTSSKRKGLEHRGKGVTSSSSSRWRSKSRSPKRRRSRSRDGK